MRKNEAKIAKLLSDTEYMDKVWELLKKKKFLSTDVDHSYMYEDLSLEEKKVIEDLPYFYEGIIDYSKERYSVQRFDEKIGWADSSVILKYNDELFNISLFRKNRFKDYAAREYFYGISISDDARRNNFYYETDLNDIIDKRLETIVMTRLRDNVKKSIKEKRLTYMNVEEKLTKLTF